MCFHVITSNESQNGNKIGVSVGVHVINSSLPSA